MIATGNLDFKKVTELELNYAGAAMTQIQNKFTFVFSNYETVLRLKLPSGQITSYPQLNTQRTHHSLAEHEQVIFALGGVQPISHSVLNSIETLRPNSDTSWTTLTIRLPLGGLYCLSVANLPDGLLCFGGIDNYNNQSL